MSQRILTNAIEKAIAHGWKAPGKMKGGGERTIWFETGRGITDLYQATTIIYSHDFAKALWGEGRVGSITPQDYQNGRLEYFKPWQHHLQQMVIAEDPIKYLGENI